MYTLILLAAYTTISDASSSFLCNDYYDNAAETLVSIRNASVRLTVLNVSQQDRYLSFDTASFICQHCWQGSLVTRDDVTQLRQYTPLWIGLVSRPGLTMANRDDWIWLNDGGQLSQLQKKYATRMHFPANFEPGVEYGAMAVPDEWNLPRTSRTSASWIALPRKSPFIYHLYQLTVDYDDLGAMSEQNHYLSGRGMQHLVCERPYRPRCHYWNYTQPACSMSASFGCHTYLNAMYHRGDDELQSGSCESPPHRRYAVPCECSRCTCSVTEWSQWSSCGSEVCTTDPTIRKRTRNELDSNCPRPYIHLPREEVENCTIPGCELLKDRSSFCLTQDENANDYTYRIHPNDGNA